MLLCAWQTRQSVVAGIQSLAPFLGYATVSNGRAKRYAGKTKVGGGVTRSRGSWLDLAERTTMQEIQELKERLDRIQKENEAKQAGSELGELEEGTLEMIYHAVSAPDPPTPEELRSELRRKMRLLESGQQASFVHTSYGRRMVEHLANLHSRLEHLDLPKNTKQDNEVESDKYERVSYLLRTVKSAEENRFELLTEVEHLPQPTGDSEDVMSSVTHLGEEILTNREMKEALLSKIQDLVNFLRCRPSGSEGASLLPLGVATSQEWEALAVAFAQDNDVDNAVRTFEVAQQSSHRSLIRPVNAVLDVFARRGDVARCQDILSALRNAGLEPNEFTHHCLIKAYLRASKFDDALEMLQSLEDREPASLTTYTLTIGTLLQQRTSPELQSKAWTLFHRMRLVAHPIPDASCYAVMIKACAMGVPQPNSDLWKPRDLRLANAGKGNSTWKPKAEIPDTERALDLFREMTSRHNLRPTVEVYSALILACARRKGMYDKALQLFRNMVEMERDIAKAGENFISAAPSRATFNALLAGCAKNGDLLRARWILAEMLRSATLRWDNLVKRRSEGAEIPQWEWEHLEQSRPNADTLFKLFYTYAAYKLPTKKGVKAAGASTIGKDGTLANDTQALQAHEDDFAPPDEDELTYKLPSSNAALVREATSLMERVKVDMDQQGGLLSSVDVNTPLLNSYMSVLAAHCDEDERVQQIRQAMLGSEEQVSLFDQFAVHLNEHSCVTVLEACSAMCHNEQAVLLAKEVWHLWLDMSELTNTSGEQIDLTQESQEGIDAFVISRVWSAMIRILAKNDAVGQAMDLLREFANRYPPTSSIHAAVSQRRDLLTSPPSKPFAPSHLLPHRGEGIIRGDDKEHSASSTKKSTPTLNFRQVAVLHLRLVEKENGQKDIKYLNWLLKAYEYNGQPRKPDALRGASLDSKHASMRRILERQSPSWSQNY